MKKRRGVSRIWDSILHVREVLLKGGEWMVGDGNSIRLWKDKWLPNLLEPYQMDHNPELRVSDLIDYTNKQWDFIKIRNLRSPHLAIKVIQIPISITGVTNMFLWPHTKDRSYKVKSEYYVAKQIQDNFQDYPTTSTTRTQLLWKIVWNISCLQKIKHFIWRVCQNAILVKDNLYKRRIVSSPLCPICHQTQETIEHPCCYVSGLYQFSSAPSLISPP